MDGLDRGIPRKRVAAAGNRWMGHVRTRVRLLFITDENSLGRLGPSDRNRTVANKIARESKRETDDDLEMFGDDTDPSVVTVRFGFGEVSGEQARGSSIEQRD